MLVRTKRLDGWLDPELVFLELFGDAAYSFWLDSGPGAVEGISVMGSLDDEGGCVVLGSPGSAELLEPQTGRRTFLPSTTIEAVSESLRDPDVSADGALGWVGCLGYESAVRHAEMPIPVPGAGSAEIDTVMMSPRWQLVFDHREGSVVVEYVDDEVSAAKVRRILPRLRALAGREPPTAPAPALDRAPAAARHDDAHYVELILRCQERIAQGDAYLLCLTNRFTTTSEEDPLAVYRRLRRANPSPHAAYLRAGDLAVLGSSPELFLEVTADRRVTTRPIKGTRARGRTPAEDDRRRASLGADVKERAENLMIVDLMRNDLGALAHTGSVAVPSLFDVEACPTVFQLVSTVTARLRDDVTVADLLRSAFPAGSMTGAPKRAAVEILRELEGGPRGIYSGALGRFTRDGGIQLAMTIRTIVFDGTTVSVGSGGGITALSSPSRELAEVALKARPLLECLGAHAAS